MKRYYAVLLLVFMARAGCGSRRQQEEQPEVTQETARGRIVEAYLDRAMAPLNNWLASTGKEPLREEGERWYALALWPDNEARCPLVAFRFKLNYLEDHWPQHQWTEKEPFWRNEEGLMEHAARVVGGVRLELRERVMLAFTEERHDAMETFTFGVPHFLRLPTQGSEINKRLPKECFILKGN